MIQANFGSFKKTIASFYQTMNQWLEQGTVSSPFISDVLQIMQLFDACRQQWK